METHLILAPSTKLFFLIVAKLNKFILKLQIEYQWKANKSLAASHVVYASSMEYFSKARLNIHRAT